MEREQDRRQRDTLCQACVWFERYEMKEILGEGGTGRVYLARDIRLGRPVAIKILDRVTERFSEEVALLQKRALSMLPTVFDAWVEENGAGVIVMEYVEGMTLKEYLSLHRQISEGQIYEWGLQLGGFLEKLHGDKILYRDLKLENIMVLPDKSLRLVDVGAAVRLEGADLCEKKRIGTFGYAAPEQWAGKTVDGRADLYSLGAVLHAVMMGEDNPGGAGAGLFVGPGKMPEGMVRAVRRCLQEKREKRYATARAFLADWRRYRRVGRAGAVFWQAEVLARYIFLYGAVYGIWYLKEFSPAVRSLLAGYFWLKAAEWIYGRRSERWEQKKSVWCRSFECGKV